MEKRGGARLGKSGRGKLVDRGGEDQKEKGKKHGITLASKFKRGVEGDGGINRHVITGKKGTQVHGTNNGNRKGKDQNLWES